MSAGQDGFRDKGCKQHGGLMQGHWGFRSVPRLGSIDHTICCSSCKVWHQLSTVAVQVLSVPGRSLGRTGRGGGRGCCGVAPPVSISLQAIRAILLASVTAASFGDLRLNSAPS